MKTYKYEHHIFSALNELNLTYYTSPVDYIVIQYGGGWMAYVDFQGLRAFSHLPEVIISEMEEVV